MANICSNIYRFIFSDGEKAKKFLDFINSSDSDKSVYNLGVKAGIKNAEGRNVREWIDDSEISKKRRQSLFRVGLGSIPKGMERHRPHLRRQRRSLL